MTEVGNKAPASDLDAAVSALMGPGLPSNSFSGTRVVRIAHLRTVLDALSSQSQAAEGMAKALEAVLNTSGARGKYHALDYAQAADNAEQLLARQSIAPNAGEPK